MTALQAIAKLEEEFKQAMATMTGNHAAQPKAASAVNGTSTPPQQNNGVSNGASQPAAASRKAKGKKAIDPNETGKLLAAKISQLELETKGDKDQEMEIGWSPSSPLILVVIHSICRRLGLTYQRTRLAG
jgi:PPE-repeat protein